VLFRLGKKQPKAVASHEAHLNLNLSIYYRCFSTRRGNLVRHAILSLIAILVAIRQPTVMLLVPLLLIRDIQHITVARRHFAKGDVNGAKLVSLDPPLVACFTDLSLSSEHHFPVLKIIEPPAYALKDRNLQPGDNLATVSMYSGSMESHKWDNFNPLLATCATRDEVELERLMAMIPDWQWVVINEGLFQVPRPYRPGLYPLNL
jgi:hypothetical protein